MSASVRSLPIAEWPQADRQSWEEACRPAVRFRPGGPAGRLAVASRDDYENRYGAFLGFLQRTGRLKSDAEAGGQIHQENVTAYLGDLQRVRMMTAYNAISKLRRVGNILAPTREWKWLYEVEQELRLNATPRPKFDRLVDTDRLVDAGLALILEANNFARTPVARAKGIRNGLMVALLALCPIRLKNFAALDIGRTLQQIEDSWWIVLPARDTKSRRADERRIPDLLKPYVDLYLSHARPVLLGSKASNNALWVSVVSGGPMTRKAIGTLVSKITFETLGVDLSPHLFRSAAASTAAAQGGANPHLASALLNHTDPRVTEDHYTRATSISAAETYASLIGQYRASD
jgi:integrase